MISLAVAQEIVRIAKKVADELSKTNDARYEIDERVWTYEFDSRRYFSIIKISCYWQSNLDSIKVNKDSDEAYWVEMNEIERQHQLLQDLLNEKISKSKYGSLNIEVQFSSGI